MREDRHPRSEVEGYIPALRRYARALVGRDAPDPVEVADHMVREAVERAALAERIVSAGNVRIWLYATLTSLNRSRVRAATARPTPAATGPCGGVTEALSHIPTDCRETLLLVVVEGFTYAEAGDILGIPRLAVANRLARARHILAERLDAALPHDVRGKPRTTPHLRLVK